MRNKKTILIIVITALSLVTWSMAVVGAYYNGMMGYCLYVPYYYVDGQPFYQGESECREVVDDARAKGLYYNPRQITGPGFDLPQNTIPGVDG